MGVKWIAKLQRQERCRHLESCCCNLVPIIYFDSSIWNAGSGPEHATDGPTATTTDKKPSSIDGAAHQRRKVQPEKKRNRNVKKNPNAPKRFKSSYIFFAEKQYKQIEAKLREEGVTDKVSFVFAPNRAPALKEDLTTFI